MLVQETECPANQWGNNNMNDSSQYLLNKSTYQFCMCVCVGVQAWHMCTSIFSNRQFSLFSNNFFEVVIIIPHFSLTDEKINAQRI